MHRIMWLKSLNCMDTRSCINFIIEPLSSSTEEAYLQILYGISKAFAS